MPPKAQKTEKAASKPASNPAPVETKATTTTTTPAPVKSTPAPAKTATATPSPAPSAKDLISAAYDGEPAVPERKKKAQNSSSASSSSSSDSGAASFEFTLSSTLVGEKTSAQIKSKLNTELFGYGVIDEIRVTNEASAEEAEPSEEESEAASSTKNKVVVVFFTKVLGKGLPIFEGLEKDEAQKITVFDTEVAVTKHDGKASGGGRASKTAQKKPIKKEGEGRGGRGGGGRGRGGDRGGRGGSERGRGRGN